MTDSVQEAIDSSVTGPPARSRPKRSPRPYLLILPAALLVLAMMAWPLAQLLLFSAYKHPSGGEIYEKIWTAENYRGLFNSYFWRVTLRTVTYAVITTVICAAASYPVAYWLSRLKWKSKSLLVFLLVLPLLVGSVVRTYGLIILLGRDGPIQKALLSLHLISNPVRLLGSNTAVIIGLVDALLPFMVLPLLSSMNKVGEDLENAAAVHGANPWQTWRRVILPLSLPGLVSGTLLVFILSMGALVAPIYLGGAAHQTLATLIWSDMLTTLNWPRGAAIAVVLILIISVVSYVYMKLTDMVLGKSRGTL